MNIGYRVNRKAIGLNNFTKDEKVVLRKDKFPSWDLLQQLSLQTQMIFIYYFQTIPGKKVCCRLAYRWHAATYMYHRHPVFIWFYPRKRGWPDLPHSSCTSNLSHSHGHSPSHSILCILPLDSLHPPCSAVIFLIEPSITILALHSH